MRLKKPGLWVLVLVAIILSGSIYHSIGSILPSIPKAHATSRSYTLVGSYITGWNGTNPGPTLTATMGDTVSITLKSSDGAYVSHQFVIDVHRDGVTTTPNCSVNKCSPFFPPTTVFPVTVDFVPGTYTYYCSVHTASMIGSFVVQQPGPDYGVSSNPPSLTIVQGSNANSTITVSSINNFAGSISLSATSSPPGPTTSFNSTTVTVPAGGTAHSKLTVSTTLGTPVNSYTIAVTAKNSTTFNRTTSIAVSVISPSSDFTIVSNPTSLTVAQSSQGTTTITLTSVNSFSGTINLATSVNPSGPTASLNSSSVTLSPGGTRYATLTIGTGSSGFYSSPVSLGSYTVTVTGTSGSLSHPATIALTVGNTSTSPSGLGNLPISIIIGIIIGVVAVVGVGVYFIRRKPGK